MRLHEIEDNRGLTEPTGDQDPRQLDPHASPTAEDKYLDLTVALHDMRLAHIPLTQHEDDPIDLSEVREAHNKLASALAAYDGLPENGFYPYITVTKEQINQQGINHGDLGAVLGEIRRWVPHTHAGFVDYEPLIRLVENLRLIVDALADRQSYYSIRSAMQRDLAYWKAQPQTTATQQSIARLEHVLSYSYPPKWQYLG